MYSGRNDIECAVWKIVIERCCADAELAPLDAGFESLPQAAARRAAASRAAMSRVARTGCI
jgi:hypothetical protein